MGWLGLLLKGKKVAGAIKSVKPQVKYTGNKSLIDKYKKVMESDITIKDVKLGLKPRKKK